ncbi:MAG TPA: molecular chaperone DnaK, partial [Planctomycetia bacterium]|nr:molecular chaperone DnaK [Planctomycetia bacterium]
MAQFAVGIDLGTTNCALAYLPMEGEAEVKTLSVTQLVQPGELGNQPLLPSFVYLPGEHELPAGSMALPWDPGATNLVGEAARRQGAKVPGRLVSSAKSWLCHAAIDRKAAVLPWSSDPEVKRISPVAAS